MFVYFNGLMLGLSLIAALGPQNVFLIRQGAQRKHALLSAVICFFCDFILACASVAGLHEMLKTHPSLEVWLICFGVAFLLYYGIKAFRQAFKPKSTDDSQEQKSSNRLQIVLLALGFSLLNPHAIIDTLVIIGSGSSQFPDNPEAFLFGVITASFLWFSSLTFTTHYFAEVLSRNSVWRRIEFFSGSLMIFLSLKLATTLM